MTPLGPPGEEHSILLGHFCPYCIVRPCRQRAIACEPCLAEIRRRMRKAGQNAMAAQALTQRRRQGRRRRRNLLTSKNDHEGNCRRRYARKDTHATRAASRPKSKVFFSPPPAIRTFDNSEVSHAALYVGNDRIAEALMEQGLTTQDRSTSFKGSTWIEVRRPNDGTLDKSPVACVAQKYLSEGNRYAYEQILLLGAICLTRKLDFGIPLLRSIAKRAMAEADAVLQRLTSQGKQPMICSEFVFRCYDEAMPEPDNVYSLEILSQEDSKPRRQFSSFRRGLGVSAAGPAVSPAVHPESLLARLENRLTSLQSVPFSAAAPQTEGGRDELDSVISQYSAQREGGKLMASAAQAEPEVGMDELEATAAQFARNLAKAMPKNEIEDRPSAKAMAATPGARIQAVIADFVTPGDLDKSPSLTTLGKIKP